MKNYKFGKKSRRLIDPIFAIAVRKDGVVVHRERRGMVEYYSPTKSTLSRIAALNGEREWVSDFNEYRLWV